MTRATASEPFPGAPRRRWPPLQWRLVAAVFVGGVAGGLGRYAVTRTWPAPQQGFAWSILTVNTAGAFALGLLLAVLAGVLAPRPNLQPLLGTGLLGAFTTFSSVVTEVDLLAVHGRPALAVAYLLASLLSALCATFLGLIAGRALTPGATSGARATRRRR